MNRWRRTLDLSRKESVVAEMAVFNAVPLVGVALLGWSVGNVLIFYWIESVAVGVWVFPKFLLGGENEGTDRSTLDVVRGILAEPKALAELVGIVAVILLLYGFWLALLGLFVVGIAVAGSGGASEVLTLESVGLAVVATFGHHGLEFYRDYWRGDERADGFLKPMIQRCAVLIGVVFLGIVPAALGVPIVTVGILVAFKFATDLLVYASRSETDLTYDDVGEMVSVGG